MVAPLARHFADDERLIIGFETADDAGAYRFGDRALIATVDFITPVCDDPRRFGRVAAANALSDVYAMGGRPLFALNVCCFPSGVPIEALSEILAGAADAVHDAGALLVGGHTVADDDLKYGLCVIGETDPGAILTNAGARAGDRLVLTKPLGTGVMINAFRGETLDEAGLEPALVEMERLNDVAARLALSHGAHAATDVTGFGLAGHAAGLARRSEVSLRIALESLPRHQAFERLFEAGVSTGSTGPNRESVTGLLVDESTASPWVKELLYDPQTSGGLLIALPANREAALTRALRDAGHDAAVIGEVSDGPAALVVR